MDVCVCVYSCVCLGMCACVCVRMFVYSAKAGGVPAAAEDYGDSGCIIPGQHSTGLGER